MTTEVSENSNMEGSQVSSTPADSAVGSSTQGDEPSASLVTKEGGHEDPAGMGEGNVPPPYTPNFKFKYADGDAKKEGEFDEFLKGVIKDKETEEKVKSLYEKAYGLDFVKSDRDSYKTKYNDLHQEYETQNAGINVLQHFLHKKDYQSFFEKLNIPKQDIMQYALLQLRLQEATPEQKQAYEASRQASLNEYSLYQQNQLLEQRMNAMATSQKSQELDLVMQRPNVSQMAQSFDARAGRVGAFRDEVIKRGQLAAYTMRQDITAEQAVNEVLSLIGQQNQGMTQAPTIQAAGAGTAQSDKKVIPNIQGRGTSPAKKMITSIADLKKRAEELSASGGG